MATGQPRTLTDDLRGRDDEALRALLLARPDLTYPVPADLAQMASRSCTTASTLRALDGLDLLGLQVLEVAAALGEPVDADAVAAAFAAAPPGGPPAGPDAPGPADAPTPDASAVLAPDPAAPGSPPSTLADAVRRRLDVLHALALAWGDGQLRLTVAARGAPGPYPCGLAAAHRKDPGPESVEALLADAPRPVLALLDRLAWGPPTGRVPAASRAPGPRGTAVAWLLARGLLRQSGPGLVELPRTVALARRGGRVVAAPAWPPPALPGAGTAPGTAPPPGRPADPAGADARAGHAALDAVRRTEHLLDAVAASAPAVLRNAGMSVRDVTALARQVECDEPTAVLLLEVACAAGLLAREPVADPVWLPTAAYDAWAAQPEARRWAALVAAWWDMPRAPGLAEERDERGGRINALSRETGRPAAPEVRRLVLELLAHAPAGPAPDPADVVAAAAWRRAHRWSDGASALARWTLREAEVWGVTGGGALSAAGRALVAPPAPDPAGPDDRPDDRPAGQSDGRPRGRAGRPARARAGAHADARADVLAGAVGPLLPRLLDDVLLQADLTAVAPGPLAAEVARGLALLASVESRGAATVYRFSEETLRRGLDAGRSGADVLAFLAAHSRTPVPQPLAYLVEDVARRHGSVRVGAASAYLRCDDEAAVAAMAADRRLADLRLVRLAPTAVAAKTSVEELLARLRAAGYAPMPEDREGRVVVRRPAARRASVAGAPRRTQGTTPPPVLVDLAVHALRSGDRAAAAVRAGGPPGLAAGIHAAAVPLVPVTPPAVTLALLRTAVTEEEVVVIGFVADTGVHSARVVEPLRLLRGALTAVDQRDDEVHVFPVARITGVLPLGQDG